MWPCPTYLIGSYFSRTILAAQFGRQQPTSIVQPLRWRFMSFSGSIFGVVEHGETDNLAVKTHLAMKPLAQSCRPAGWPKAGASDRQRTTTCSRCTLLPWSCLSQAISKKKRQPWSVVQSPKSQGHALKILYAVTAEKPHPCTQSTQKPVHVHTKIQRVQFRFLLNPI